MLGLPDLFLSSVLPVSFNKANVLETALDFGGNSSGRITLSMQNFNSYSLFLWLTFGCHFVEQSEKEGYILKQFFL